MVKNIAFLSATVAMLVLSGCTTKEPAIDATAHSTGSATNTGTNPNVVSTSSTDNNAVIAPIANVNAVSTSSTDNNAVIAPIANANDVASAAANGANGSDGALVSILFDYDQFNIREDMQQPMSQNSRLVKGKNVKLEGNCDEFGSDEYNFALGLKRATAVKNALVNNGMNPDSITMVSFGESNPVCLEKTQECWAKNRRVDFKLP
ncbi:MAG: OmpA family protein [Epsilonproteobacteria bacterium]|nr:OmpA family protein [Campylobacterota bacterium]